MWKCETETDTFIFTHAGVFPVFPVTCRGQSSFTLQSHASLITRPLLSTGQLLWLSGQVPFSNTPSDFFLSVSKSESATFIAGVINNLFGGINDS